MKKYTGTVLGFNYEIEKETDLDFKQWLKAKLERYTMLDLEKEVIKDILGITQLEQRLTKLEK